jgi:hypothetical protein
MIFSQSSLIEFADDTEQYICCVTDRPEATTKTVGG